MSSTIRQLPLPFVHRPDYSRSAFLSAPSNAAALAWLDRTPDWPSGRLALWGEAGCGKTHLLHIWAAERGAPVVLGADLARAPPASAVAIDDAMTALADEELLLHLLNAAAEARHPVLMAASLPPGRWMTDLPDLRSRLRATTAIEIGPAEDSLLDLLLARLLAQRQLAVPLDLRAWLRLHLPRSAAALREAVSRLDAEAMTAGRAISRTIAASVVRAMEGVREEC